VAGSVSDIAAEWTKNLSFQLSKH